VLGPMSPSHIPLPCPHTYRRQHQFDE
jgi:hypothetical protein